MAVPAFDIQAVVAIARQAGAEIMALRPSVIANPEVKGDGSPVTLADKRSSAIVIDGLRALTPTVPVISEENDEAENAVIVTTQQTYWIVDPLDGTRTFIDGHDGFGVHIGLIDNGVPVAGVVYFPAQDVLYFTEDGKAYKQEGDKAAVAIRVRETPANDLSSSFSAASSWSRKRQLQQQGAVTIPAVGGGRLCVAAEGVADIALLEARFSYWDIAAAHAVLYAAGGDVFDLQNGQAVRYPAGRLYVEACVGGAASTVSHLRDALKHEVNAMQVGARPAFVQRPKKP